MTHHERPYVNALPTFLTSPATSLPCSPPAYGASASTPPIAELNRLRGLVDVLATTPPAGPSADNLLLEVVTAAGATAGALVRLPTRAAPAVLAATGMNAAAAAHLATRPTGEPWPRTGPGDEESWTVLTLPLRDGDPTVLVLGRPDLVEPNDPDRSGLEVLAGLMALGLGTASLRERTDLLTALVRDAEIGFTILDAHLRYVMINDVLADINGVPATQHIGRHLTEVLPDLDPEVLTALNQVLDTGEPLHDVEVRGRTHTIRERKTWLENLLPLRAANGEVLGVAAIVADAKRQTLHLDVDATTADDLITVGCQLAPVVENDKIVELIASAADAARRCSAEQSAGLARLARLLNAASTVTEVADTIRQHSQEAVGGRFAALALLEAEEQQIRLLQSPKLPRPLAQEWASIPLDSPNHSARCIREKTTIVITDPVTLDDVQESAVELERLRAVHATVGITASAAIPLLGTADDMIGALVVGWTRLDDLDEERLPRLRALAELCSQAIERARLADACVAAAERSQALANLAAGLTSAVTLDEVWEAVALLAPAVVRARVVTLGLVDPETSMLEYRFPERLPPIWRLAQSQPLSDHHPQSDAARTGQPVLLATPAEHEERYPGLRAEVEIQEITSSAVFPLRDSSDEVIGTLTLAWTALTPPVSFDALRPTLDTMAELCGQTLERARLHTAEHELIESLQRRLLRPVPVVPGLAAHAVYRVAQTAVGIGGDFHDGIVLPSGQLAVVVGDITGHGIEAAADMGQLRTLLATLLATGTPLDHLFSRADSALDRIAGAWLATAVAAIIDPTAHTLSYVHAGHPPLVLHTPDGTTFPLENARGGLLGAGIAGARSATVTFEPSSVLIGYTDGLIESREIPLDEGIADVVAATAEAARAVPCLDPAGIAAFVLDHCVGDRQLTDDVTLLVVTCSP
jgi:PAS domain-containing protein